jgi:hypothetical protein
VAVAAGVNRSIWPAVADLPRLFRRRDRLGNLV